MKNYYEILGISKDATTTEIREAYSKLLRKFTPEKNSDEFQQIREAYEILKDEKTRNEYDAQNEHGEEIQMHIEKAEEAMKNKKYNVAIREYKKILVIQPTSNFARNNLGLALAHNNQLDDSLKEFKKLIEMYPKNETYLLNIGHVYWTKGNFKQAERYFLEAYELDSINIQIVYDIVDLYLDKKEELKAIEFLENCIDKNKNDYTLEILYYFKILEVYILEYNEEKIDEVIEKIEKMAIDDNIKTFIGGQMANLAYKLYEAKIYKFAHKIAQSATLLLVDDKDVYELYEECKKFYEIFTLYKKLEDDENIIPALKGPIYYYLYGDVYDKDERELFIQKIIKAIDSYLNYENSYLVIDSINNIKKEYFILYKCRKEIYDDIYNIAIEKDNIYNEFLKFSCDDNICYTLKDMIKLLLDNNLSINEKNVYLDNILKQLNKESSKVVYNSIELIKQKYKNLYNLNLEILEEIKNTLPKDTFNKSENNISKKTRPITIRDENTNNANSSNTHYKFTKNLKKWAFSALILILICIFFNKGTDSLNNGDEDYYDSNESNMNEDYYDSDESNMNEDYYDSNESNMNEDYYDSDESNMNEGYYDNNESDEDNTKDNNIISNLGSKNGEKDYEYINYNNSDINNASEYYCIYVEADKNLSEAQKSVSTLEDKKIDSKIIEEDGFYKVRVGSSKNLSTTKEMAKDIEARGFETYILGYSTYFENKLKILDDLYNSGQYDNFKKEYNNTINELDSKPIFARYKKILENTYN